jgi:hypothetical protein
MEALAAIERLIKKKIDRVLVPGFQPDGGTAAALMGRERESRQAPRRSEAPARPLAAARPPRPAGDPIFSRPYEPGAAPAAPAAKPEAPQQSKRRQPQVAALLGGLKRA